MENWTEKTGAELGDEVVRVGRSLWDADSPRREAMLRAISRYEGRAFASLEVWSPSNIKPLVSDGPEGETIRLNLCQSLTDTVTAKIAGTQQPKVSFVVSNGDWSTRRKGPKAQQLVEGLWASSQEPFTDIWDLGCAVFRDAAVCGLGAVKTWSDIDASGVIHERTYPWELLVDPQDARYGRPSHLFQVTNVPRATLLALFPECAEALNEYRGDGSASNTPDLTTNTFSAVGGASRVVDVVRCYEWWSLPLGKDVPGKHVLAFQGGILIEAEWTRDRFPFALIRWNREFQGWHGRNLIDSIAAIDDEMNDLVARIVRTVRLTGMGRTYKHVDDTSPDEDNADAITIRWDGAQPPVTQSPSPISAQHIELVQMLKGFGYEFSGVNAMTATAQKQAGIEAASAIRLVADLQSERFSVVWRAYQQLFVEIARDDIACVRELSEDDPNFAVKWPGSGFLRSISWSSIDLKDELFVIQVASAPSVKGTPADRLQTAQEMFGAGRLSADSLQAVQTYLDLPGEIERGSVQRSVVDRYMETWLDATPEESESGKLPNGTPLVRPPIPWMRLEDALLQVVDGYMQAELDDAPDHVKELFLRWIELADKAIEDRAKRKAANIPPPAPPMGPPGPNGPQPLPAGGPIA